MTIRADKSRHSLRLQSNSLPARFTLPVTPRNTPCSGSRELPATPCCSTQNRIGMGSGQKAKIPCQQGISWSAPFLVAQSVPLDLPGRGLRQAVAELDPARVFPYADPLFD